MERSVAIKKLSKILGKSLGYRVDDKAPKHDEREAAREASKIAAAERNQLAERLEARRIAILAVDTEYQEIKAAHAVAKERADKLFSTSVHYKFTVGVTNSMFFAVKAQGDSWEEIIEKLSPAKQEA